jgi:hypothetical protein
MAAKSIKKRSWLYRLFNDLYEVHLIFPDRQEIYWLQHLKKIDNKQLRGLDQEGNRIEFRSVEPFDYRIKKHY